MPSSAGKKKTTYRISPLKHLESIALCRFRPCFYYFFFLDPSATLVLFTLSLHDALPIWFHRLHLLAAAARAHRARPLREDRRGDLPPHPGHRVGLLEVGELGEIGRAHV